MESKSMFKRKTIQRAAKAGKGKRARGVASPPQRPMPIPGSASAIKGAMSKIKKAATRRKY